MKASRQLLGVASLALGCEPESLEAFAYDAPFLRRESLEDIPGLIPEAAAEMTVAVHAPEARRAEDSGWQVVAFLNELDELDRGRFSVAPDGRITAELERVADGISIFGAWE